MTLSIYKTRLWANKYSIMLLTVLSWREQSPECATAGSKGGYTDRPWSNNVGKQKLYIICTRTFVLRTKLNTLIG